MLRMKQIDNIFKFPLSTMQVERGILLVQTKQNVFIEHNVLVMNVNTCIT